MTRIADAISTFKATVVRRQEPVRDRYYDSPQYIVQDSVDQRQGQFTAQEYAPPRQSAYWGIGRDPAHAPTPHRFFQTLDINARNSVMGWPFQVPKIPGALVIGMPVGQWNSQTPRVNIKSGKPMAYGNMANLSSPIVANYEYAKLVL